MGLRMRRGLASAAVFGDRAAHLRLPSSSSIFTAEAHAINLALKFVASSDKNKFMICSDSLSCLLAIESCKTKHPVILKIVEIYKSLVAIGKEVIYVWIPSHVGIYGNTVVDQEAKDALDGEIADCPVPYTDMKPLIAKYISKIWQDKWDLQVHNKLHGIQSDVGKHADSSGKNRKEQVVLTRCRIGHTRTTHSYILNSDERPECIPCNCAYTIQHVLLDCVDVADVRRTFYTVDSLKELFTSVAGDKIIQFLKAINLYSKI